MTKTEKTKIVNGLLGELKRHHTRFGEYIKDAEESMADKNPHYNKFNMLRGAAAPMPQRLIDMQDIYRAMIAMSLTQGGDQ